MRKEYTVLYYAISYYHIILIIIILSYIILYSLYEKELLKQLRSSGGLSLLRTSRLRRRLFC